MTEELNVDESLSDEEKYRVLLSQIRTLINPEDPVVTNLSNISAAIFQTFKKISWAGFYICKENKLFLGPFQGKVACTEIEIGNGVCGTAASLLKSVIVPDVHEFPGHIACDSESNSEIVVPVIRFGECVAVLDLDSKLFDSFNEIDKQYLEQITEIIAYALDVSSLTK